jgi:hypothetical protein
MKSFWTKEEISVADDLLDLAPKLREDFLSYHTDFDTTFKLGKSYAEENPLAILDPNERVVWKVEGLRYALPEQRVEHNMFLDSKTQKIFPTAASLTEKYIGHCGCSGYSSLDAGGIIKRHVDIENKSHNTVRIHIPLIIPEGDLGFEVNGIHTNWSDLFAFDNGEPHSAYNRTAQRRLIYIIDLTRSFLSIPDHSRDVTL